MRTTDAVLAAGHVTCTTCSALGFPTDAVWLDGERVLVRYEPSCEHAQVLVKIVVPSRMGVDHRCQAITLWGRRCRNRALPGGWCRVHLPGTGMRPGASEGTAS